MVIHIEISRFVSYFSCIRKCFFGNFVASLKFQIEKNATKIRIPLDQFHWKNQNINWSVANDLNQKKMVKFVQLWIYNVEVLELCNYKTRRSYRFHCLDNENDFKIIIFPTLSWD